MLKWAYRAAELRGRSAKTPLWVTCDCRQPMAKEEVGVQPTLSRIQSLCESSRAWNMSLCHGGKYKYQWNAFALTKESRAPGVGGLTKIVGLGPPCTVTSLLLLPVTQVPSKGWSTGAILESGAGRKRVQSCFLGWRMLICSDPTPATQLLPATGSPRSRLPQCLLLQGRRHFSFKA